MGQRIRLFLCLTAVALCAALFGCAAATEATVPVSKDVSAPILATVTPEPAAASTPTPLPTIDPAMQPYTIAWISDTQGYCAAIPETFNTMTQWIVDHKEALNIQYVFHTGDVVNDPRSDRQWKNAENAMITFRGQLPVFAVAGNHDIGGINHDYSKFGPLMDKLAYQDYPTFGGMEANGRRRYDLITIGHDDYILIGCGYVISRADLDWMNQILAQYQDRTAILILHWYLNNSNELQNDGLFVYRNVVMKNPNIKYIFCGHRHTVMHTIQDIDVQNDKEIDWQTYAFMGDYQGYPEGGGGYIALFTFDPVKREIRATSYSPVKDDYNYFDDTSIETFTLPYLEWDVSHSPLSGKQ
ncbi:MAG: metallophosphoesterase [Clostridia bacterium]